MSYIVGDTVSTRDGQIPCIELKEGFAVFRKADGSTIDLPNIVQQKSDKVRTTRRSTRTAKAPKAPKEAKEKDSKEPKVLTLEEQEAELERTIAAAQASLAALSK